MVRQQKYGCANPLPLWEWMLPDQTWCLFCMFYFHCSSVPSSLVPLVPLCAEPTRGNYLVNIFYCHPHPVHTLPTPFVHCFTHHHSLLRRNEPPERERCKCVLCLLCTMPLLRSTPPGNKMKCAPCFLQIGYVVILRWSVFFFASFRLSLSVSLFGKGKTPPLPFQRSPICPRGSFCPPPST